MRKQKENPPFNPPKREIEAFARCIFPAIQKYFESEEGQQEFAEWKAQKDKRVKKENNQ